MCASTTSTDIWCFPGFGIVVSTKMCPIPVAECPYIIPEQEEDDA